MLAVGRPGGLSGTQLAPEGVRGRGFGRTWGAGPDGREPRAHRAGGLGRIVSPFKDLFLKRHKVEAVVGPTTVAEYPEFLTRDSALPGTAASHFLGPPLAPRSPSPVPRHPPQLASYPSGTSGGAAERGAVLRGGAGRALSSRGRCSLRHLIPGCAGGCGPAGPRRARVGRGGVGRSSWSLSRESGVRVGSGASRASLPGSQSRPAWPPTRGPPPPAPPPRRCLRRRCLCRRRSSTSRRPGTSPGT